MSGPFEPIPIELVGGAITNPDSLTSVYDYLDIFAIDGVQYPYVPDSIELRKLEERRDPITTLYKDVINVNTRASNTNTQEFYQRQHRWQVVKLLFDIADLRLVDQITTLHSLDKPFFVRFDDECARTISDSYNGTLAELHCASGDSRTYITPTYPIKQENYDPLVIDSFDYHVYLYNGGTFVNVQHGFSVNKESGIVTFDSKLSAGTRVFMRYAWRMYCRILDYKFSEANELVQDVYKGHIVLQQLEEPATEVENYFKTVPAYPGFLEDVIALSSSVEATIPTGYKSGYLGTAKVLDGPVDIPANWNVSYTYSGTKRQYSAGVLTSTAWASNGSNLGVDTSYTARSNDSIANTNVGTVLCDFTYTGATPPAYLKANISITLTQRGYEIPNTIQEQVYLNAKIYADVVIENISNPNSYIELDPQDYVLYKNETTDNSLVSTISKDVYIGLDENGDGSIELGLRYGILQCTGDSVVDLSAYLDKNINISVVAI